MQTESPHILRQRNAAIDAMRLIMALFVVAIHTLWSTYPLIEPVLRMAVPFFFFVSGIYLYSATHQELQGKVKRALYKLLKIVIGPVLILVILVAAYDIFIEHKLRGVLDNFIHLESWMDLVLCKPMYCLWHLWYLSVYIYVLITLYLCSKMRVKMTVLICIAIAMIVLRYYLVYTQQEIPLYDFLCDGVPCVIAGMASSHYRDKLRKVSTAFWVMLLIVSLAAGWIQNLFLPDIFTLWTLTAVFALVEILSRYQSQGRKRDTAISRLGVLGCDLALYIYIFHMLWLHIFESTEYFTKYWAKGDTILSNAAIKGQLWLLVSVCTIASIIAVRFLIRQLRTRISSANTI